MERAADADSAVLNCCILILRRPRLRVNKDILITTAGRVATTVIYSHNRLDSIVGAKKFASK